jgi:hypothetical protein
MPFSTTAALMAVEPSVCPKYGSYLMAPGGLYLVCITCGSNVTQKRNYALRTRDGTAHCDKASCLNTVRLGLREDQVVSDPCGDIKGNSAALAMPTSFSGDFMVDAKDRSVKCQGCTGHVTRKRCYEDASGSFYCKETCAAAPSPAWRSTSAKTTVEPVVECPVYGSYLMAGGLYLVCHSCGGSVTKKKHYVLETPTGSAHCCSFTCMERERVRALEDEKVEVEEIGTRVLAEIREGGEARRKAVAEATQSLLASVTEGRHRGEFVTAFQKDFADQGHSDTAVSKALALHDGDEDRASDFLLRGHSEGSTTPGRSTPEGETAEEIDLEKMD